jgi:hypothetical protein
LSRAGARLRDGAEHRLYDNVHGLWDAASLQAHVSDVAFGDFIVADQRFLVAMETFFMKFSVPGKINASHYCPKRARRRGGFPSV